MTTNGKTVAVKTVDLSKYGIGKDTKPDGRLIPKTNHTFALVGTRLHIEVELDPAKVKLEQSKKGKMINITVFPWATTGIGTIEGTMTFGLRNPDFVPEEEDEE